MTSTPDGGSTRRMLEVNVQQREYYESRYEALAAGRGAAERAANPPTRGWTRLRRRIQRCRKAVGVDADLLALHRAWLGDLSDSRVLDLGCFSGNELSLWIAERSREYLGVDLSPSAIGELREKLRSAGIRTADAVEMDFLHNDWPAGRFDVVYAYSVLHHFADLDVALAELQRVLAPNGIVITMDPLALDPVNRLARTIYRPFQSDKDWEFPFDRDALDKFAHRFEVEEVQGLQGSVRFAYPLMVVPGLRRTGEAVAERLRDWDLQNGKEMDYRLALYWHIAMKLRRRARITT